MADTPPMLAAGDGGRRFRLRRGPYLLAFWCTGVLMGLLSGVFPAAMDYAINGNLPGRRLGVVVATNVAVLSVLWPGLMALLTRLNPHPLAVGPAGLQGFGPRGKPVTLPWDVPAAVRPGRAGLIPHLLVEAPGLARSVVVPLAVADPHGLFDAVCGFAGPDHPLALALADRLPEG